MAQPVTAAQVKAVVDRALRRDPDSELVLVQGSASSDVASVAIEGRTATVHATGSPLDIRRAARSSEGPVIVVTPLGQAELGDDLIARAAGRKIWPPDRWLSVRMMFGVRGIAADLAKKRHLADALIEARPVDGYPAVRGMVLELPTALDALLSSQLVMSDAVNTLDRFIAWIDEDPGAAQRINDASTTLNTDDSADLDEHLVRRFGDGVRPVLAIVRANKADELIPMLLVGGVVHHPEETEGRGTYELELETNRVPLDAANWQEAGEAALVAISPDKPIDIDKRQRWSLKANQRLVNYQQGELAERCPAIEPGFDMRLAQVGRLLSEAIDSPPSGALEASIRSALDDARTHWFADPIRVERAEMAARLIRRGDRSIDWGTRLATAGDAYRTDGAWLDRARNAIARGDTVDELAGVYRRLSEQFGVARHRDNKSFASLAQSAARDLPDDVIGIEDIMSDVVAPIAAAAPVLLLVFDGMGYESFTEVAPLFERLGFTPFADPERIVAKPCFAALPTVTEKSRTTLFAGTLRDGNQESERRAFAELSELLDVSKSGNPPVVHHKAKLRDGGIDSVPTEVLDSIANDHQQVVAVVLNNIDERLKDVAGPIATWGFAELHPLEWLLRQARTAGRVIVATSDHGHILDRDAEQRPGSGGGERWRAGDAPPADDEIVVEGPRVVTADNRAVMPFVEQAHYGSRRNGYHGGLCPQEVLVPIGVFSASDELLPDWSVTGFPTPDWWYGVEDEVVERKLPAGAVAPSKPKRPKGVAEDAPTLFEPEPEADDDVVPERAAASWVDETVAALQDYRRPQIRLSDEHIASLLRALERNGDQPLPIERLAAMAELPTTRIGRYVSQLQQLVNIDGYSVLSVFGNEVHFQKHLLDTQLEAS